VAPERDATQAIGDGRCGTIEADVLAEAPLRVLGDHLRLRGPVGMAYAPFRGTSLGAASEDRSETQLRIAGREDEDEEDHAGLLVVATELYRRPGDDLETNVRRWLGEEADDLHGAPNSNLEVFFTRPAALGEGEMVLVLRAIVGSPDGTVQHIAFFARDDRADGHGRGPCAAIARRMVGTLTPGEEFIDTDGGRRVLRPGIAIDLPPGYAGLRRGGRDFEVHYFYRLTPLGGAHAQLGVYLGHEPSTHVRDVLEMRSVGGAMLGQSVQWSAWTTAVQGARVQHMEAIMEVPGGEGLFAHAFLVAEDPDLALELKALAETLSLFAEPAE